MFGFPQLAKLLEEQRDAPALINVLLQDLAAFTGPSWEQEDDVTLVTLHRSLGYGRSEIATQSTTRAEEMMKPPHLEPSSRPSTMLVQDKDHSSERKRLISPHLQNQCFKACVYSASTCSLASR
jgi:hypothetical protein